MRLQYKENSLVSFFKNYYKCKGWSFTNYENNRQSRERFHLSVRPRISHSSASLDYSLETYGFSTDLGMKTLPGVGVEAEFVMPFNRNKWAAFIESTLTTPFKSKQQIYKDFFRERDLFVELNYQPLDVPIGIRYYMFLSPKSRLFTNIAYVVGLKMKSHIQFSGSASSIFSPYPGEKIEPTSATNFAFGFGWKYANRYSVEARYNLPRDATGALLYWNSPYRVVSLILGFTIF